MKKMRNYTTLNLKQSSRAKFWHRNFPLKILRGILCPCSPILYPQLLRRARLRYLHAIYRFEILFWLKLRL
ncbi:MAG: hypothetical protein D8H92_10475 [Campylobacter sp.]|nr:MAG: hypothetical protein D8H92_10475 [Campylobacter sp.]